MSWFDNQEQLHQMNGPENKKSNLKVLQIKLPGGSDFITVNKNVVKRQYSDSLGKPILIIVDEAAELLQRESSSSEEGKEENQLKSEIESSIKSITQLGRSAEVHCLIATQRNDSKIISGQIQNNCLDVNTKVPIK